MPSLSRAIDGLVRKDLVSRIEDPEDPTAVSCRR